MLSYVLCIPQTLVEPESAAFRYGAGTRIERMRVSSPLACVALLAMTMAVLVVINPFGRNLGVRNESTMALTAQSR
jgi:hypothetical protein